MARKKPQQLPDSPRVLDLIHLIIAGDLPPVLGLLAAHPELVSEALPDGASRGDPTPWFITKLERYLYEGDTALHIAAAAYHRPILQELLRRGAKPAARNRRGAEPLHAATDGGPQSPRWNPEAQPPIIAALVKAGSDPNAVDDGGVTPLHRAVRNRCGSAVRSLLVAGADPRRPNRTGSTPLHLAVMNTGRGGTSLEASRHQQLEIIETLLAHGAAWTDRDRQGKTVLDAIGAAWIRSHFRHPMA